jgi:hypothetical protein
MKDNVSLLNETKKYIQSVTINTDVLIIYERQFFSFIETRDRKWNDLYE